MGNGSGGDIARDGVFDLAAAKHLLQTMWRIRAFEERLEPLKHASMVHGLTHLSIGQEAVAAGVCTQLRDDEAVYSNHRGDGHALAKGVGMGPLMAELMGRVHGCCRGLGGSMHVVDVAHGFLGATGVVGGNLPFAVGSALAGRVLGRSRPVVVFFGDGAAQAGIFSESVNLASLWQVPVVFVCENNGFAEFTPRAAHTRVARVSDLAAPYQVAAATVDGNDAAEVYRTFASALAQAREGRGPFLLECLTHRLSGHYVGDPGGYRAALEDEEWRAKDPIVRLVHQAAAAGWFDDETSRAAESAARQEVEAAVAYAVASPFPDVGLSAELTYAR
ncbi:MAG: thiamine pyrophosphate-dependent dehydrogenase E1 component subunit alpha [Acidimicrobiales bacterium]